MSESGLEDPVIRCAPCPTSVLAGAWPAVGLAIASLVPFLNKAFLVDDPYFLAMAQQILKHPLHPMDFQICWNLTDSCTKAYVLTPGNALMGYALLPTILGGASEWIAHATQMVFAFIAILAMSSLVLRFGWTRNHAVAGTLLLVAIPPFLPMASTAMPDLLATALALVAIERLAAWKADRKSSQGIAAAVAIGLAGFARSHLALLGPLGAFFLLENTDPRQILPYFRRKATLWSPVLAGGILLFAIILVTRERSMGLDPPPAFRGTEHIASNLVSYLLYFSFPLPLVSCWAVYRWKTRRDRLAVAAIMAAVFAAITLSFKLVVFLAVLALGSVVDLLIEALLRREHHLLFLLLWVLIPLPIVYYGHLPIKYLLPTVPAIILICFQLSSYFAASTARLCAMLFISLSTVYSLLTLHSDAEFADFGRTAMYSLIRPEVAAGRQVWYYRTFSSYWYAQRAGATLSVPDGPQPKPGDLLVFGDYEELGRPNPLGRFPHGTLLKTLSHAYSFGRTMGAGIGLYTNLMGFWLWGFGDSGWDRYELWRIDDGSSGTRPAYKDAR